MSDAEAAKRTAPPRRTADWYRCVYSQVALAIERGCAYPPTPLDASAEADALELSRTLLEALIASAAPAQRRNFLQRRVEALRERVAEWKRNLLDRPDDNPPLGDLKQLQAREEGSIVAAFALVRLLSKPDAHLPFRNGWELLSPQSAASGPVGTVMDRRNTLLSGLETANHDELGEYVAKLPTRTRLGAYNLACYLSVRAELGDAKRRDAALDAALKYLGVAAEGQQSDWRQEVESDPTLEYVKDKRKPEWAALMATVEDLPPLPSPVDSVKDAASSGADISKESGQAKAPGQPAPPSSQERDATTSAPPPIVPSAAPTGAARAAATEPHPRVAHGDERPGTEGDRFLYFAYGSNMSTTRLANADRAPTAVPLGRARLHGHLLKFHKRSRDGSSKADARWTGLPTDVVEGVVFRISEQDRRCLDHAEGRGNGYIAVTATVKAVVDGHPMDTLAYVATADAVAQLPPYGWYIQHVLDGATEHGLPEPYVNRYIRSARLVPGPPEQPNPCPNRVKPHSS